MIYVYIGGSLVLAALALAWWKAPRFPTRAQVLRERLAATYGAGPGGRNAWRGTGQGRVPWGADETPNP